VPESVGRDARLATGGWRLATGGWRLAAGDWRLAAGGWRLAAGGWRLALAIRGPGVRDPSIDSAIQGLEDSRIQGFEDSGFKDRRFRISDQG